MTINIKRALLTGTAIVAVGAIGVASSAQAQTAVTAAASGTWASSGAQGDDGTIAQAVAGANLDITGNAVDITVTNDATADDGSGDTNTFALGTVTDSSSAQDGDLTVTSGTGADLTVTIGAATLDGNVVVQNQDANNSTVDTTVTNNLTVGGTLDVTNQDVDAADTVTLDVDGNVTVTGATTVTAAAGAANDGLATLEVAGNATFTGGLTLDDDAGGATAQLTLDGSTAQTVAGTIDGGAASEGAILISNASGATFSGVIGGTTTIDTITIAGSGADAAATFQDAVSVGTGIVLGDGAGTDTNTLTFDSSTAGFTVTGAIDGTAGDTDNMVVSGGNTVVTASAIGGGTTIEGLTVSGNGTELDADAAITAATINVGSGATLDAGAAVTSSVTLTGTLNITGGAGVTGTVEGSSNGVGTIDVDATSTVSGNIGGDAELGSTTSLAAVDIATGVTFTAGGDYNVTTTTLNGTGTISFATATSAQPLPFMVGDVVAAADGDGNVVVEDGGVDGTLRGDFGTSSRRLATLDLQGATVDNVRFEGNLFINTITANDADRLWLVGSERQIVSGDVTGGDIFAGNGAGVPTDGIFQGTLLSLDELRTFSGGKVTFLQDAPFGSTLTNNGTVAAAPGVTVTNNTQVASTGQFDVQVTKTGGTQSHGQFVLTGGAAYDLADDTVRFEVASDSQPLTVGASVLDNVFVGTGAAITTSTVIEDNSFLYGFSFVVDGGNLDVTVVEENSIAATADTGGNENVGNVLLTGALLASTDTQINQIQGALQSAGSADAVNDVLEATQPTVDGGAVAAGFSTSTQSLGVTGARLASLRDGGTLTSGVAAGNHSDMSKHAWMQAFGSRSEQDERDNIAGYDADTYGLAVGIDSESIFNNTVVGAALSYADTDVDSDNANSTETDIDSYQLTIYADHDWDDRTYVSGMLGYAYNDIEQDRFNVGGVTGLTASADYDSNQYIAYTEVGRDYNVGSNTVLTPHILAHYQHIDIDGYTETGAGGANLTVDNEDMDIFELGIGATLEWEHHNSDGSHIKPSLRAEVRHDLVGDDVESTSTFAAGGASFESQGADPADTSFNLGAGVTWYTTDNWELTANYDFRAKSDYDEHSGSLRAGYRF